VVWKATTGEGGEQKKKGKGPGLRKSRDLQCPVVRFVGDERGGI